MKNNSASAPTTVTERAEHIRRNRMLLAYNGETMNRISIDSVLYFETDGRKIVAVLHSGRYVVRSTLTQLEEQYQDVGFIRVSKSMILNFAKEENYTTSNDRTMIVTLVGNVKIRVSRKCDPKFKANISGN